MQKVTITKTAFRALDGTLFDTREECLAYESTQIAEEFRHIKILYTDDPWGPVYYTRGFDPQRFYRCAEMVYFPTDRAASCFAQFIAEETGWQLPVTAGSWVLDDEVGTMIPCDTKLAGYKKEIKHILDFMEIKDR